MSTPAVFRESSRLTFPGMRVREAAEMRSWLLLHESEYDHFDYNVRIGAARDPGPAYPDWVRTSAKMCSQLRMDAIAWHGQQATLLELKQFAYPDAAQQLATYGAVWASENAGLPTPRLLLVCRRTDEGTMATATAAGVAVEVLGPG